MILTKRKIPRVGVAALILGGGCGDDGGSSTAEAFCNFEARCDPVDFEMSYTSGAQCVDEISREIREVVSYYSDAYGEECGDAIAVYYACVGRAIARANRDRVCDYYENVCDEEYYDLYDVCGFY